MIKPTISIVFLNEILFPDFFHHHLTFQLLEREHRFPFADDLEVHTLELPKFRKTELELIDGLDIWLYFLRHAEKMDSVALPKSLDKPVIIQAVEALNMLTQSDIERERYEARRKFQLDYNTSMKYARKEGEAEGLAKGEKIGAIHLCERLLQRSETPNEQLQQLSLEELTRLSEELQKLVTSRQ